MEISVAENNKNNEIRQAMHPSWSLTHPVRRTIFYFLVFIFTGILLSWLFTGKIAWGFSNYLKKIFYIMAFLLTGTGHIFLFPVWFPNINRQNATAGIVYSLLLALLLGLATFSLFVFTGVAEAQLAVLVSCAFLLPVAIQQAWYYFDFIAAPETDQPWFLPNEIPAQKMVAVFLDDLPVKIKVKVNYYDAAETLFKITVPARLTLGKMFHRFLIEKETQSTKIQLLDQQQQPYAWRFWLQRPFSITILHPELTLTNNKVRPKDTILAERIRIS